MPCLNSVSRKCQSVLQYVFFKKSFMILIILGIKQEQLWTAAHSAACLPLPLSVCPGDTSCLSFPLRVICALSACVHTILFAIKHSCHHSAQENILWCPSFLTLCITFQSCLFFEFSIWNSNHSHPINVYLYLSKFFSIYPLGPCLFLVFSTVFLSVLLPVLCRDMMTKVTLRKQLTRGAEVSYSFRSQFISIMVESMGLQLQQQLSTAFWSTSRKTRSGMAFWKLKACGGFDENGPHTFLYLNT